MKKFLPLFWGVIVELFISSFFYAQVATANLSGKVVDNEGNAVPAAAVLVVDLEAGLSRGTTTNDNGIYHFIGLNPGNYEVKVQHVAFSASTKKIELVLGQNATLNFTLVPKNIELGTVEVVAQAPKFELQKSDVSSTVRSEQIMNLPLDSRSILNLGAITPGVKSYGGSYPSSGAISSYNFINLYVNGTEWKSNFNGNIVGLGQTASPLPQDAIQEFKIIQNAYDAEYTRGGSILVSAVTRRGTNTLKGNAFVTLENKSLTNRGPFQKQVPDYSRKQVGLSLSGPLIQDKLFFAFTYELNDAVNVLTVNPGRPAYNPDIWSKYAGDFDSPRTTHLLATKITYQQDENNFFNLSWNFRHTESKFYFGGTVAYQAGLFGKYTVSDLQLEHTHIFNRNMTNQLILQYLAWRHDEPTISSGPAYIYPSITLGRATFPIQLNEDHFTLVDKLTFTFGDHVMKAGLKITNLNAAPWFPYYKDGEFLFATDTSKAPYQGTIGIGMTNPNSTNDAKGESHGWALGAYIQDGWRVNDRLLLNLGLRWDADLNMLNNDYTVRWANDPVITSNIPSEYINRGDRKNQLANFSPRINFNYDLFNNGLTILRGGYGLFYDRTVGYIGYFEYLYSNWGMYTFQNPGTTDPNVLREKVLSGGGSASPSIYMINKNIKTPRIDQWSLGVGHQFTENLAIGIDYVNKHYVNIFKAYNANYYKPSIKQRILTNKYSDIRLYDSFGEAWWYGFLSTISYRTQDVFAQLSYTLSWAYTNNDGISYNLKDLFYEKRSIYDERHRFVLNFSVNLPYEFQISGIATLASPTPYSVYIGQDLNDDNNFSDDWIRGGETAVPSASKIRNWYKMLDLRVTKFFSINQFRIGVFLEAYNVGNWFNAASYFGRKFDAKGNPYSNFGQATDAYLARTIQLGTRVFLN
ncbi:carboxypeptidase regulatory-like domain-containing protein [Melioribacteraceae bacterium 4301-Me]|uniref:TonB-dependent receptor n=1 Tax=Pyranulibacter aquaticus TaxID=3163344 RepID=UPI003595AD9D